MTQLKTVDIKGKAYVEVNERIKYFRQKYENGSILTDIIKLQDGVCVIKANVYVNDELVATGHAYEKEGSTFINKTSYIENCETSAIGRALGILGIGIDTSVASYEEVGNAVEQQDRAKVIKSELPKKLELECSDEKLLRQATTNTLKHFRFANWKELDFNIITEREFLDQFTKEVEALS